MTAEEQYAKIQGELWKRQSMNAESYDRAILTLSSAALGFSLAFLRDPTKCINGRAYLSTSWWLFIGAIVLTVGSFLISQHSIRRQLELSRRALLEGEKNALTKPNRPAQIVESLAYGAGAMFVLAIFSTAHFASLNTGGDCVSDKKQVTTIRPPVTTDRPGQPFTTHRPGQAPEQRGQPAIPPESIVIPRTSPAEQAPTPAKSPKK